MEIIKVVSFTFIALFIYLSVAKRKEYIEIIFLIVAGTMIFFAMLGQLNEVILFITSIASRAQIDIVYIGIVFKILAIAYLTSFSSEICKDAGVGTLSTKVEFAGKIMILALAIPILMAVLDSILQIL